MTVQELIDILSDLNPEADCLAVFQPSYPLIARIRGVAGGDDDMTVHVVLEDGHEYGDHDLYEECTRP